MTADNSIKEVLISIPKRDLLPISTTLKDYDDPRLEISHFYPTTSKSQDILPMGQTHFNTTEYHSLRELRDIVLDRTVASDEPLNIAVDSYSICQNVPINLTTLD